MNIQMETLKTFEILKYSSRDSLEGTNKSWKAFSKISTKRNFMQKVFQALSWFPGKPFQIRNFKIYRKLKVPFSKIQNICFWPQAGFNLIF